MNRWECDHPGCKETVIGFGGGIGLRAIGWYFELGPTIYCPQHYPYEIPCTDNDENRGKGCRWCAAKWQAVYWQEMMENAG